MRAVSRWFVGGLAVGVLAGSVSFAAAVAITADDRDGEVGAGGAGGAGAAASPQVARFVEQSLESGVRGVYDGGFTFYVGGGVATFDCDADERPDLYLAGGANEATLVRNASTPGGALEFRPVTDSGANLTGVSGAYPLDVDSDGVTDLAVLRVGENRLLRGLGDCRFTDSTEQWGLPVADDWTAAFSATWEGENTLPTLAVGNYLTVPPPDTVLRECATSYVVRPSGSTYGEPAPLEPGLCTLSALFHDWNGTGRADLRLANDRHYFAEGGEQLWRIDPEQPPTLYDEADGWAPLTIWGMGIAVGDVTGDDLPEVVLTSQGDNKMQTLAGGDGVPTYEDIAIDAGTTAHRPFVGDQTYRSTAWHPALVDVNNDGISDLFLSKGNVNAQVDHSRDDPSNLLLGRGDATFVESAREAGVLSLGQGRGAALVDLNADGMLDLVEVNRGENVRLWRNVGGGTAQQPEPLGSWLALRLTQPAPNVDAVGAHIEARTDAGVQRKQVLVGGGHAGGHLGWQHWGLGEADAAQVRVTWPDGEQGPWVSVQANTFVVLDRAADSPGLWSPSGG